MDSCLRERLLKAQENEITEWVIYNRLAELEKGEENQAVLRRLAADERRHYEEIRAHTGGEPPVNRLRARWYILLARVLGVTFALRLMESKEDQAQDVYHEVGQELPALENLEHEEAGHEDALLGLLQEERLKYASSVVLGLNDALVELPAALAGFTLALQQTRLIALVGLVTGISASMSMAASEYLSIRHDSSSSKDPARASLYTGSAYIFAVFFLVLPFFVLSHHLVALGWTLINSLLLILVFTYYLSVAQGTSFRRGYLEMSAISIGVASISFLLGLGIRELVGVDI